MSEFAVLIFYILTIASVFVLRRKQPNAERPYRAFAGPRGAKRSNWRFTIHG